MDSLHCKGKERCVKKKQKDKFQNAFVAVNANCKSFITSVSPSNRKSILNNSSALTKSQASIRSCSSAQRRRQKQNEIERLQAKLRRPLHSVEIDKLYRGYRQLRKCTRRKHCECYHCELLEASSAEESPLSGSDASSGSEANDFEMLLNRCFHKASTVRKNKVYCEALPKTESVTFISSLRRCFSFRIEIFDPEKQSYSENVSCWRKILLKCVAFPKRAVLWILSVFSMLASIVAWILKSMRLRKIYPVIIYDGTEIPLKSKGDTDEALVGITVHQS